METLDILIIVLAVVFVAALVARHFDLSRRAEQDEKNF
jgi:hypothetical protein